MRMRAVALALGLVLIGGGLRAAQPAAQLHHVGRE